MKTFAIGQKFDPTAFNRELRIKLYRDIKKIIRIRTINIKQDDENLLMDLSDAHSDYKKYFLISLETMIDIAINQRIESFMKSTSILLLTQDVCDICKEAPYVLLTDDQYNGITDEYCPIRVQENIKPSVQDFVVRYSAYMIKKHKSELAEGIYLVSKDIIPKLEPFEEYMRLSEYLTMLRNYKPS